LRAPFADPGLAMDIAKRADVIKLNDDEVGKLASWLRTGEATLNTPRSPDALAEACAAFESNEYLADLRHESRRGRRAVGEWQSGMRPGS
jgi:hypothetical protein